MAAASAAMSPNGKIAPVASWLDEVGSAAHRIGYNGRNSACHRLVDDQSPSFPSVRWQDEQVGRGIDGGQFALVDEAQEISTYRRRSLQFCRSSAFELARACECDFRRASA